MNCKNIVVLLIFFVFGCENSMEDEPNHAPEIEVIGFVEAINNVITFKKDKAYEFKFQVTDGDGDKIDIRFQTPTGKVEKLAKDSEGYSAFYTPNKKGEHRIKIIATDKIKTATRFLSINFYKNIIPVANFSSTQISKTIIKGDTSFIYVFDPTRSYDEDGKIKRVLWNFNGALVDSTLIPITTKFNKFDTYNIQLEVFDDLGGKGTADTSIYNALPAFAVTHATLGSNTGLPLEIQFVITKIDNNFETVFDWDFGDSTYQKTRAKIVNHSFKEAKTFTVKCSATDIIGTATKTMQIKVDPLLISPTSKFIYLTTEEIYNNKPFGVDGSLSKDRDGKGIQKYLWYFRGSDNKNILVQTSTHPRSYIQVLDKVGLYSLGLKVVNGSNLESTIYWNSIKITNSKPMPLFKGHGTQYYSNNGPFVDLKIIENKSSDPDPGQRLTYTWYVKEGKYIHVAKADNQLLPKLGLFKGKIVPVKLVMSDGSLTSEVIIHITGVR